MAGSSASAQAVNELHQPDTRQKVDKFFQDLTPNDWVVIECFSDNCALCHKHSDIIEKYIMNHFMDIKFVRINAGLRMKGSIESLPVDSYPTYLFYTVTEVGGLQLVDKFVPRDFAKIDLDDEVDFGELIPLNVKPLTDKLRDWIEEKRDELKAGKISREAAVAKGAADLPREKAAEKRYGLRDRRTRKKSGEGSSR